METRIDIRAIPPWETDGVCRIRDPIALNNRDYRGSPMFLCGTRVQLNGLDTRMFSCLRHRFRLKFFRTAREDISSVAEVLRPHQRLHGNWDGFLSFLERFDLELWNAWFLRRMRSDLVFRNGVLYPLLNMVRRKVRLFRKEWYLCYS